MIVTLTPSEIAIAYTVAGLRQGENLAKGRTDPFYGKTDHGFNDHVIGCIGELALAKSLDRFWSGNVGNLKARDVGSLQVRATEHRNGRLILHERDADADRFFLVRINGLRAEIPGWICARDGKLPAYWKDPGTGRPAFFVPDDVLNPHPRDLRERAA